MADSYDLTLASELAAAINAATFAPKIRAEVKPLPRYSDADLERPRVAIYPRGRSTQSAARRQWLRTRAVQIMVLCRIRHRGEQVDDAHVAELVALVASLDDFAADDFESTAATWNGSEATPLYDPDDLAGGTFRSTLTINFLSYR